MPPGNTKKEALVGTVYRKCVESVEFSFYRHILNYHFYRSQLDTIQTSLLEKACTILLSIYKRFAGVPFSLCFCLRYFSGP